MTRRERVLTAIRHQEADKVPKGEIGAGFAETLVQELLGKDYNWGATVRSRFENWRKFREALGIDIVSFCLDGPSPKQIGRDNQGWDIQEDIYGRWTKSVADSTPQLVKPALAEIEHVNEYEFPSSKIFDLSFLRMWAEETDFFVMPVVTGGFEASYEFLDFESFMIWCHTNPEEIKVWTNKLTQYGIACARRCVEAGADAVVIADDMAYNTQTFLSPQLLRELIFPYLHEEVKSIKALGVPVFLHSDGNLDEILGDIVDIGFDGWHALQPSAGVEIGRIKREYGDRLCLMGNIDIDLLCRGTPSEIEHEVRNVMEIAAPGGGFILGSNNALGAGVSLENAKALYLTGESCGRYGFQRRKE